VQSTLNAQATERDTKGIKTVRGEAQPKTGKDGEKSSEKSSSDQQRPQQQAQPIFYNGQWVYPPSQNSGSGIPSSQVVADTRLNQILVVATPEDFTYVASLIAEFDKPVTVEEPYERKLNYASAIDVLASLVDLLKDTSTGTTQLPGGGALQTSASSQTLTSTSRSQLTGGRTTSNTRGGSVTSSSTGSGGVSADGTTAGAASTGVGGRADVIQGPTEDNAPVSVLVNKVRIVADPMSNSILVMGKKEDYDKVDGLLDKLDRKPAQVYLATVIGQLTLGEGFEFGIDYLSNFNGGSSGGFASSKFTKRDDVISNNNISDLRDNLVTSAFGPAAGFNVYGKIGDSVESFVTALETTKRFKVLSRPSIFAMNNKKAVITSGQLIPVPSQSISVPGNNNTTGSVTTTVEYRDVVLKLEVVPLINSEGEVNLTIAQVNDTVVGTQLVEPNEVPIIGTEQLITSVTVPNGQTIVLGGLISEEKTKDTAGMPFISRVPVIGNLFKDHTNNKTRKELIIFIQPVVVTDNSGLKQASFNEDIRTGVGAEVYKQFPQVPVLPSEEATPQPAKKKSFFGRLFSRPTKKPAEGQ
jgi:general secretion pathway protein D